MRAPALSSQQVRDALADRHREGSGCFWSNRDGRLLAEAGRAALPVVEEVILQDVLPFYHVSTESLDRRFPGLFALLVTYFAIGKDTSDDRAVAFFRRLCGSVRVEAMWAINLAWLCRAPAGAIPEPLLTAIREVAEEGSGQVRDVARWLIERAEE